MPAASSNEHRSDGPGVRLRSGEGRAVIAAAVLGSALAYMSDDMLNVALPSVSDDLGVGVSEMQWVVNGYFVTMLALMLTAGSFGDIRRSSPHLSDGSGSLRRRGHRGGNSARTTAAGGRPRRSWCGSGPSPGVRAGVGEWLVLRGRTGPGGRRVHGADCGGHCSRTCSRWRPRRSRVVAGDLRRTTRVPGGGRDRDLYRST